MDLQALKKLSYGLYVLTSKDGEKLNGQIANTVFQVTSEPPQLVVSVNKKNLTHEFIKKSRIFAVSILSKETPLKFIGHFGFKSGREKDKFAEVRYKMGKTGAPLILDHTLAHIEAEVVGEMDAGTHTLFVGKVVEAEVVREGEPMTYAHYQEVKGGTTPKTAPSYVEKPPEVKKMDKYRCSVCGYLYDPEKGDPEGGIPPGTPFEMLPEGWVCPVCGADKSLFRKVEV